MDGSPFTGDVNLGTQNSANWATYLTGTLGAGGKGYFVLDVTKPGTTDGLISSNFTKTNASTLVVMDKTDAVDDDIGHIFEPRWLMRRTLKEHCKSRKPTMGAGQSSWATATTASMKGLFC